MPCRQCTGMSSVGSGCVVCCTRSNTSTCAAKRHEAQRPAHRWLSRRARTRHAVALNPREDINARATDAMLDIHTNLSGLKQCSVRICKRQSQGRRQGSRCNTRSRPLVTQALVRACCVLLRSCSMRSASYAVYLLPPVVSTSTCMLPLLQHTHTQAWFACPTPSAGPMSCRCTPTSLGRTGYTVVSRNHH